MTWIVGLTGGIGSGKSAVADLFAGLGATIVDADAISHELTRSGGNAIAGLRKLFGEDCIGADGAMDRAWMRRLVFTEPAARQRLESLLHPMIREESRRRLDGATGPYAVHVVPLLIESPDYRQRVQRVAVVDCPEDVQVERVVRRNGLDPQEVRRIIAAQIPRAERLAAADDVIDNGGALAALQPQVETLHERYCALAAMQGQHA
jgi:dephospho-CoA kinase